MRILFLQEKLHASVECIELTNYILLSNLIIKFLLFNLKKNIRVIFSHVIITLKLFILRFTSIISVIDIIAKYALRESE